MILPIITMITSCIGIIISLVIEKRNLSKLSKIIKIKKVETESKHLKSLHGANTDELNELNELIAKYEKIEKEIALLRNEDAKNSSIEFRSQANELMNNIDNTLNTLNDMLIANNETPND